MDQMQCPACGEFLEPIECEIGRTWECVRCNGSAVTTLSLRQMVSDEAVHDLWRQAKKQKSPGIRPCPKCSSRMYEVDLASDRGTVPADLCTLCSIIWFDYQQFAVIRPEGAWGGSAVSHPKRTTRTPASGKRRVFTPFKPREKEETIAIIEPFDKPDRWYHYVLGAIGVPVVYGAPTLRRRPFVTWSLLALMLAVNVPIFFQDPETQKWIYETLGVLPRQFFRYGGITMVTAFFLHGDIFHLLGNMYFLLIVGKNVEDCLGRWRYGLLLVSATLLGDIFHSVFIYENALPLIGASGGISGVILFFALRFPRVRFAYMWWLIVIVEWFRVPVIVWLFFWVGLQLLLMLMQVTGATNVSALAHLGGAAVGLLSFLIYKRNREAAVWAALQRNAEPGGG